MKRPDRKHAHVRGAAEARVTGRPRLVVVRTGGRIELPDSAAYVLVTVGFALALLVPTVMSRMY